MGRGQYRQGGEYIDPFGFQVTNGTLTGYVQNYSNGYVSTGETIYSDFDLKTVLATADAETWTYNSTKKYGWGHGNGEADIGAYVTVASADAKNINVSVEIILKTGADIDEVKANIAEQINEYLQSTVFADSYVSYAKLGSYILRADGVLDYDESSFTINGAKDNVALIDSDASVEIAVLNNLTVTTGE